jgi:hypothetical protein
MIIYEEEYTFTQSALSPVFELPISLPTIFSPLDILMEQSPIILRLHACAYKRERNETNYIIQ